LFIDYLTPIKCSFSHQMNNNALEFIDAIQKTKNKEGLILIKRKLLEICEREIPNFQPPSVSLKIKNILKNILI